MKLNFFISAIALLLLCDEAIAQLPVEVFAGQKKATVDIMFFRFFKKKNKAPSPFLFFNRNRSSMDYKMTASTLPQFGFTEAISYNVKTLHGLAPVVVASILNRGVYPKVGMQYAHMKSHLTLFSWLVSETKQKPSLDYFLLLRYTPTLKASLHLFSQVEWVNTIPTQKSVSRTFTQRVRIGIQQQEYQFGLGIDLMQSGRTTYAHYFNPGIFLRYEF